MARMKVTRTKEGPAISVEEFLALKQPKGDLNVEVGSERISVTSLDRVYWPDEKLTKFDLLTYYLKVSSQIMPFLKDRSAVVRKVSEELQTYLIDLNQLSEDYFNKIGPAEGARLTWSATNKTHFSLAGAQVIAGIVLNALPSVLSAQIAKKPIQQ